MYKRMGFQKEKFKYSDITYWLYSENGIPRVQCARERVLGDGERDWKQKKVSLGL